MAFFFKRQWYETTGTGLPQGYANKLVMPQRPYYHQRLVINRTRSLVRTEISKFLSQTPSAIVVPSTAEDEDIRSAYAAEQAWESISARRKLKYHFSRAAWWISVTGNGFIKTWWDQASTDQTNAEQPGDIRFGAITPFHLFIPDLREQDIEDQPYVINAYTKPLEWCKNYFSTELDGYDLKPTVVSANQIVDESVLNLSTAGNTPDSCIVMEAWIKAGATNLLPNGGVVIMIDDCIVGYFDQGLPYNHDQYPFAKFEQIPTSTFYASSVLEDTNSLQREYNVLRSEISEAGKRMAKPQLLAARNSIIASSMTNEPGQIILYKQGYNPPTPIPLAPLPEYYVSQQDRVLSDIEDLSGQHEVSKGSAPPGVTAGTAINYLQEKDDAYLTPAYQSIEQAYEKIAGQTIALFVQFVDIKRKIKTIGSDGTFDTLLLSGDDLKSGTDIRIEPGSSVGQSRAAKQAYLMDLFSIGAIDAPTLLKLLEIGGAQKVLDSMSVAEKKAQRENIKMKMLDPAIVEQANQQWATEALQAGHITQDPNTGEMVDTTNGLPASPPPVVPVDDFDDHQVHIRTHNMYRMSQEYEVLADPIKKVFETHVEWHQKMLQQSQLQTLLGQIPGDGTEGQAGALGEPGQMPGDSSGQGGAPAPADPAQAKQADAILAGNGVAPTPPTSQDAAPAA
jgi:hypothetical protein